MFAWVDCPSNQPGKGKCCLPRATSNKSGSVGPKGTAKSKLHRSSLRQSRAEDIVTYSAAITSCRSPSGQADWSIHWIWMLNSPLSLLPTSKPKEGKFLFLSRTCLAPGLARRCVLDSHAMVIPSLFVCFNFKVHMSESGPLLRWWDSIPFQQECCPKARMRQHDPHYVASQTTDVK